MPAKRKSDAMEPINLANLGSVDTLEHPPKKARVDSKPKSWLDIELDGEDTGGVPVYDDCAEIRRKIRLLQKTPGWKVTQWLREIGGINNNSFSRFMSAKGKNDGAANGTYYAAYVYFEKVRILQGKKKTAKRNENEITHPDGFPLTNPPKYIWGRF